MKKTANRLKEKIKSYLIITMGTLMISVGVYFFEFTNHFTTGGVSGISIVLSQILKGVTPAQLVLLFNGILLLVGFFVLGKKFVVKTVYSAVLLSVMLNVLEAVFPLKAPLTNQKLLELFFDMIFVSFGSALIFNEEASSGGTDIIAMILKRYTKLDIGKALLWVDFFVIGASLAVFGVETGMFSFFAIVIRAFAVDTVIESFNASKFFIIITEQEEKVLAYVTHELERGSTLLNGCSGGYTKDDKSVIIVVVDRRQAVRLKHEIKRIDQNAFTIISTTGDVIGDGFKPV
ncbi:MAG: YitT family protein [Clostridia bacterium]|nr:YitT family protein [Clostridia bacterium]